MVKWDYPDSQKQISVSGSIWSVPVHLHKILSRILFSVSRRRKTGCVKTRCQAPTSQHLRKQYIRHKLFLKASWIHKFPLWFCSCGGLPSKVSFVFLWGVQPWGVQIHEYKTGSGETSQQTDLGLFQVQDEKVDPPCVGCKLAATVASSPARVRRILDLWPGAEPRLRSLNKAVTLQDDDLDFGQTCWLVELTESLS